MKVKLWCCTHDFHSKEEEVVDLKEHGFSDGDIKKLENGEDTQILEEIAKDFFYESKQPAWGFEIIENK